MKDEQAAELAKSCVTALVKNDLKAVAFTDTLRRGLQKWLDKTDGGLMAPDGVDWQTLTSVETSRFPGLDAFLFRLKADTLRDVLVGVDEANQVTVFGFVGVSPNVELPEVYRRLTPNNPWRLAAGFSTRHNIDGLLPFEGCGSGYSTYGKDDKLYYFHVSIPPKSWETLSLEQREQALNGLESVALNSYWLASKECGIKEQVHITVVESQDGPLGNGYRVYVGVPPQAQAFAERLVDIPKLHMQ
ncbi:MAG: hypothetical protein JOY86_03055 [Candidatus Eremiobacteraeota bacterium]|nr:hypothetical protein [Candidatus Eremiobacteraeota bacterium]